MPTFPLPLESYADANLTSVVEILRHRIQVEPMNLVATGIFVCAIVHTLFANRFLAMAHAREHAHRAGLARRGDAGAREPVSFSATALHFLGEVEAVFGVWAAVLFV